MRTIDTSLLIDATPEAVWSVLTDTASYPDWNPFVRELTGDLRLGERLRAMIGAPGAKPMTFKPTVVRFEPGRALEWLGVLGATWIFSGRHRYEVTEAPEGAARLEQSETFGGLLLPLLWRSLDTDTRRGFEAMNVALAAEVVRRGA